MGAKAVIMSAMAGMLMKQKDLAARAGMAESTLSYKLNDPGRFTLNELRAIARITAMTDAQIIETVRSKK